MEKARTGNHVRGGAILLVCVLLMHVPAPAVAQDSAPPPTPDKSIGARGVDVITGKYYAPWPSITIGQPGAGGLTYSLSENSLAHDTLFGALNASGSDFLLTYMGVSSRWTKSGTTFLPADGQGGSLTFNSTTNQYTYTTPQGSIVIIDQAYDQPFPAEANQGRVVSVTHPTGETLTYHYDTTAECLFFSEDGQCTSWLEAIRPMAVSSSLGYVIKYEYDTNTFSADWLSPNRVLAINSAIDACSPLALQCTGLTKNWPSLSFTDHDTYPAYGGTITDNLGRSYVYTESGTGVTGVQFPGSSSNDISVVYTNGRVNSLTIGGETWTYTYSDSGSVRTTTVTDSGGHITVTKSDLTTMRVISHQNKAGEVTGYQYDSVGRLKRVTQPEGNYVQYQYDGRGNRTEIRRVAKPATGLADIVVTLDYPDTCVNPVTCNKPTAITDPRGKTTNFIYDPTHGGVTQVELPAVLGGRPTTKYDYVLLPAYSGSVWRPTTIRSCATAATCTDSVHETETSILYTANSRLPREVKVRAGDESGTISITLTTYDHNDDIETIDGPLSGTADTVYLRYDDLRRQVGAIGPDPDGGGPLKRRAMRMTFTTRGLPTVAEQGTVSGVTDAHWSAFVSLLKATMAYDSHGRLTKATLNSGGITQTVTQYSYDGEGRPECTAFRMNPSDFGALPGACTASTSGSFGPDRISRTFYDMADRVNKVTAAYGTIVAADTTQGYTANGLIGWIEDGNGNRSTYEYDGFDRLAQLRYPHSTTVGVSSTTDYDGYLYDAASNVIQQRLRDGQIVTYEYDDINRLIFRDAPGSTKQDRTFGYDLLGRMLSVAGSGHTNEFDYNALGQMESASGPLGTVSYQYDSGGRRTRVTWPDGFYVDYDYDTAGAMTKVRENGATSGVGLLAVYGYDDLGRRTSLTRGNGVITTYGYDAALRLERLTHDLPGSVNDLIVTFDYNPAGQITRRKTSNDLYSWTAQTSPATTTLVNGQNQITSQDGLTFSHDGRGNMTSDGDSTYGYDAENRLITAPGGVTLEYDAAGRLYEVASSTQTATRFLYDGANLIAEYDAAGNLLRRYVHGAGIDEPLAWYEGASTADRRWLTTDERGSVVAATDARGVATVYTYDAYGIPGQSNAGRFQYTGQTWIEAAGLYYYKSRFYDPDLGRFLQADRIGYSGGLNLYAYVAGDPVNLTDPFGMESAPEPDCLPEEDCERIEVEGNRHVIRSLPVYGVTFAPPGAGGLGMTFSFWGGSGQGGLNAGEGSEQEESSEEPAETCTGSGIVDPPIEPICPECYILGGARLIYAGLAKAIPALASTTGETVMGQAAFANAARNSLKDLARGPVAPFLQGVRQPTFAESMAKYAYDPSKVIEAAARTNAGANAAGATMLGLGATADATGCTR